MRFSRGAVLRWSAIGAIAGVALIPISGFDTMAAIGRISLAGLTGQGIPASASPPTSFALASDDARTASTARASTAAITAGMSVDAAADTLTEKLAKAGLTELTAKVDGKRVVVSGAILHEQHGSWLDIQRWFDVTFGSRYVLASAVETRLPGGSPKFDLQAIAFSESPYVITGDGQRRYPGAVLDKGWVIKEIGERRLTLTKNGKELALSF